MLMPQWNFNHKTLYHIHIPKTAGSTLRHSAQQIGIEVKHIDKSKIEKGITKQHQDFKTLSKKFKLDKTNCFTVLREPWERTLSAYNWNTKDDQLTKANSWLKNIFKQVLNKKIVKDNHFLPQKHFISDQINVFYLNRLGQVEKWIQNHFEKSFKIINSKRAGKVKTYKKIDKETLLDKETLQLWHELYDEDVALWNQQERKIYVS